MADCVAKKTDSRWRLAWRKIIWDCSQYQHMWKKRRKQDCTKEKMNCNTVSAKGFIWARRELCRLAGPSELPHVGSWAYTLKQLLDIGYFWKRHMNLDKAASSPKCNSQRRWQPSESHQISQRWEWISPFLKEDLGNTITASMMQVQKKIYILSNNQTNTNINNKLPLIATQGLSWWLRQEKSACHSGDLGPTWRRVWKPTPVFLL